MNEEQGDTGARVIVVGGGVAGLETLLALDDLAGDRVSLTLVAPSRTSCTSRSWSKSPSISDPPSDTSSPRWPRRRERGSCRRP